MGRPISQKFFGQVPESFGESVGSVIIDVKGTGYTLANTSVVFGSPELTSGVAATGVPVIGSGGKINGITFTPGSGYLNAPIVAIVGDGANASAHSEMTITSQPGLKATAFLDVVDGGTSAVTSQVVAQKGSRRYKVTNGQGTGVCTLVTTVPVAGQMNIVATKPDASTFKVAKLTEKVVYDAAGNRFEWGFAAASTDSVTGAIIVQLTNG